MPWDDVEERRVAATVLAALRSEKYAKKNDLFLRPFDLAEVPGYVEKVGGRPLDLQTIGQYFENDNNYYDTKEAFWRDLELVFTNAIKYHGDRKEGKWIAKIARDMIKAVKKERSTAEGKGGGGKASSGGSSGSGGGAAVAVAGTKAAAAATATTTTTVGKVTAAASNNKPRKPGKPKLPKLPTSANNNNNNNSQAAAPKPSTAAVVTTSSSASSTTATATSSAAAEPGGAGPAVVKPKLRIKLSTKITTTKKAKPTPAKFDPPEKKPAAATKPRIKMSTAAPAAVVPPPAAPVAAPPPPSAPVVVQKINASAGIRGKELPQGVVLPPPKPATPKSTTTPASGGSNKPAAAATKAAKAAATKAAKAAAAASSKPFTAKSLPMSKSSNAGTKATKPKKVKLSAAAAATSSNNNNNNNTSAGNSGGAAAAAAATSSSGGGGMDEGRKRQTAKVILGLRRRRNKQLTWFLNPITDKKFLVDYRLKIHSPMDITTIQTKTSNNEYQTIDQFCGDVRQVFANALIYNTNIKDSLRPLAVDVLLSAEMLFEMFLRKPYGQDCYRPLLYCWKLCLDILDTLYNLVNPAVKDQSFAFYFSYPVAYYCGGNYPPDYLQKVQHSPMDFGTVTEKLITGVYQKVEDFCTDCERIIANCRAYYAGRDDGKIFLDQAEALDKVMKTQLNLLRAFDRKRGIAERQKLLDETKTITARLILPERPPPAVYLSVLEELRIQKYTDKATKITEPATGPFEDVPAFADYSNVIAEPLDIKTIAQRASTNVYDTPEDFEYDVLLVFKNAEQYNLHRGDAHSVQMARYGLKKFKSIFYSKMAAFDDPDAAAKNNNLRISINMAAAPVASKVAAKAAPSPKKGAGNLTPRTPGTQQQQQAAKTKQQQSQQAPQQQQTQQTQQPPALQTQPVPLHIAIAKVKEAFPLRRTLKMLQSWEADCARFFKELMRHPWITTVRPKFIFHVPVPMLFPELKVSYEHKIRQPMDLTTIECTLLAGNRYASPEAFVSDVALVFANSILFNKDGKDVGDVLSCAYYDASVHLLRYARWLSHELLLNHVSSTGHTDLPLNGLPPFRWQLTVGNRKLAHQETESIVMKEPLEKSVEGDRYTWMETECEKLLKAIRHQSDQKYMKFFVQTIYPPDYTAFISKPMDWEKVQKTLKKRQYDTIGQMADDLRLIFSNALKYNARHKDFDAISNEAYQAADIMSGKLETAINKMLLSVADRLERERIDHANAEREIDAAERLEEAEFRATWKKEGGEGKDPPEIKIRMHRRGAQRQAMDFEVPFFDEEETTAAAGSSHHQERSFVEVVKFQKGLYEKQRKDKLRVHSIAMAAGTAMLERIKQKQLLQRVRAHQEAAAKAANKKTRPTNEGDQEMKDASAAAEQPKPSSVLKELERPDRVALQLKLNVPTKKKVSSSKKRKRVVETKKSVFGGDDSDSE